MAQPGTDSYCLALRSVLRKVTMPTSDVCSAALCSELRVHGEHLLSSLRSGDSIHINALPHGIKVAAPRARLWFLGRHVKNLPGVGAPSPDRARARFVRRTPNAVRLDDRTDPDSSSTSPSLLPAGDDDTESYPPAGDDDTASYPPAAENDASACPLTALIRAMQEQGDGDGFDEEDGGDWEDDHGEGLDAQLLSLTLLGQPESDEVYKRRLMVNLAHACFNVVFRNATKARTCARTQVPDLHTCAREEATPPPAAAARSPYPCALI